MPDYYLIDTNVMLAASAYADVLSNLLGRAMPKEEEYRELVYQWLCNFQHSTSLMILDEEGCIRDEYDRNMPFNNKMRSQEYGLQVLQNKQDRCLVEYVPIEVLEANGERVAVLSDELSRIVTDREDMKWVAAALSAKQYLDVNSPIVYGAESDWYLIEGQLTAFDICFNRLLPEEWYQR